MVLLAVHDPAVVQGQGLGQGQEQGPGLGQEEWLGQGPGLGQGSGRNQGVGVDKPLQSPQHSQSQPQSQQPQLQQQLHQIELTLARQLKAVWISHPHADHHLGLLRVLSERRRLLVMAGCFTLLVVVAPPSVLAFLRDVSVVSDE